MLKHNKHHHNALQIISVQHELAMAIGTEISLREMLQVFMQVCVKRLGLVGVHCYIYTDAQGWPETRQGEIGTTELPSHFISVPNLHNGVQLDKTKRLDGLLHGDYSAGYCYEASSEEHFYSFELPAHGLFILQLRNAINSTLLNALKPIFSRLGSSCQASILHETLLREMLAREEVERTLQHQAFHNSTTDLPNRHMLLQIMEHENFWSDTDSVKKALLCIEIDNFKKISDIMGHTFGDEIQKNFAAALKKIIRSNDSVSQIDTDVFMVIIDPSDQYDKSLHEIVTAVITRLKVLIAEPMTIGANAIQLSIKAGYDIFPNPDFLSEEIIKHAEIAKSESALQPEEIATFYDASMQEKANNRVYMEQDLKLAAFNNELSLWWQPQYNAERQLIGAEALLRWKHKKWGFVSPGEFIPIAEESELIEEIGDWVLETACQQLAELCELGIPEGFKKLSINVNARQLIQENFVESVLLKVEQYNIPSGLLAIELTESTLVQSFDRAVALIKRLKRAGIDCSIDDFGTGYSSLSYIKQLPFQTIKIDLTFVRDIHLSKGDQAIAKTLLYLGKMLNKDIIAEGVESDEELQCLLQMGCNQFQGYYFDKPTPLQTLKERWYPDNIQALLSA